MGGGIDDVGIKMCIRDSPSHGDPLKLLAQYHALQSDIAARRAALRDELQAALERSGHGA